MLLRTASRAVSRTLAASPHVLRAPLLSSYSYNEGESESSIRYKTPSFRRDVVFYAEKMKRLGKHGNVTGAFDLLEDMKEHRVQPNRQLFNLLIKMCGEHGHARLALKAFNDMKRRRLDLDERTITSLLTALSSGSLPAEPLVEETNKLVSYCMEHGIDFNIQMHNALLRAHAQAHRLDLMMDAYASLKSSHVRPDATTFSILIGAAGKHRDAASAASHERIDALSLFEEARRVLRPRDIDVRLLSSVISALKQSDAPDELRRGVQLLQEYFFPPGDGAARGKLTPDVFIYTLSLVLLLRIGTPESTAMLRDVLARLGSAADSGDIQLDAFIVRPMLQACATLRDVQLAEDVWKRAGQLGLRTIYSYETMVETYVRLGEHAKATDIFSHLIKHYRPPYRESLLRDVLRALRAQPTSPTIHAHISHVAGLLQSSEAVRSRAEHQGVRVRALALEDERRRREGEARRGGRRGGGGFRGTRERDPTTARGYS